ncbi:MAG: cell division ATP-binding protein FtsE [Clostridia bacterium]|nr:cell division ATP-binding protein FtsE [Oscillospiraceae bacterium]MBR2410688.1 cell division ATP-binding protein FtsE [Clostridia bacterium]
MIDFIDVSKTYQNGTKALTDLSLHIDRGEFVFVVGSSGAGKSTFLKMIMREEVPSSGSIVIDGVELNKLKAKQIPYYRRKLGIVFQDFRLIPNRTVYDNVAFAMHVIGAKNKDISRRVTYALSLVGLSVKAKCFPNELSGGEQQRVALARALVNQADIIIADEPTGNIDPEMSKEIVDLLNHINANKKTTIIMVTHEVDLAKQYNKRMITINNGTVVSDTDHPELVASAVEERVDTAPNAFYEAPLEDVEIEDFLDNYTSSADSSETVSD